MDFYFLFLSFIQDQELRPGNMGGGKDLRLTRGTVVYNCPQKPRKNSGSILDSEAQKISMFLPSPQTFLCGPALYIPGASVKVEGVSVVLGNEEPPGGETLFSEEPGKHWAEHMVCELQGGQRGKGA